MGLTRGSVGVTASWGVSPPTQEVLVFHVLVDATTGEPNPELCRLVIPKEVFGGSADKLLNVCMEELEISVANVRDVAVKMNAEWLEANPPT